MAILLETCQTSELSTTDLQEIRALLRSAFGPGFGDVSWQHALGGSHLIAVLHDQIAGHLSIVDRLGAIDGDDQVFSYIEAVAVRPDLQGLYVGTMLVAAVNVSIAASGRTALLASRLTGFYARLGWRVWSGPSYAKHGNGLLLPAAPRGEIMVFDPGGIVDIHAGISIEHREGDVW